MDHGNRERKSFCTNASKAQIKIKKDSTECLYDGLTVLHLATFHDLATKLESLLPLAIIQDNKQMFAVCSRQQYK